MVVFCLRKSTRRSNSTLISDLFSESVFGIYLNNLFGSKRLKHYTVDDQLCAAFIRYARSNPFLNQHLDSDVYCISTH